jgi:hypothetical protein
VVALIVGFVAVGIIKPWNTAEPAGGRVAQATAPAAGTPTPRISTLAADALTGAVGRRFAGRVLPGGMVAE